MGSILAGAPRRIAISAALATLVLGLAPGMAPAQEIEELSGDLRAYLIAVGIVGTSPADAYEPPDSTELAQFTTCINQILAGQFQAAHDTAQLFNYRVIYYRDTVKGGRHIILREQSGFTTYRGVYALNLTPERYLVVESPHPLFDGTRQQGADLYIQTGAVAFMQTTTHRNNHTTLSPCDGTFTDGEPYRLSDMAHNVDTFYQVAHMRFHLSLPPAVCLSVHGMGATTDYADVNISNGTTTDIANFESSLSRRLAARMNELLAEAGDTTRSAVSHQDPGAPATLSGNSNKQGRFTNGDPNPCIGGVTNAILPERFLHMEQQPSVRDTNLANASKWSFVTQSLRDLMPNPPPITASAPPALAITGHWPFDANANDVVVGRNGTITGGVVDAIGRPGRTGSALDFDGSTGYVTLPNFDYAGNHGEFTLSLWFESPGTTNSFQYLVSQGPLGTASEVNLPHTLHLYLTGTAVSPAGALRARFTLGNGNHWLWDGATSYTDSQWHMLALTWDFDTGAALYVDGAPVATNDTLTVARFRPEGPMYLGARSDLAASRHFGSPAANAGRLDEVQMRNRALSPAEIDALFAAQRPLFVNSLSVY